LSSAYKLFCQLDLYFVILQGMPAPTPKQPKDAENWKVLFQEITDAFSPGAPIQERELFAGRANELQALMDAVMQRGRHAVLFGERGVGKTSMVNIFPLTIAVLHAYFGNVCS
jgi:ATP-dependent Clp protease ATP-binding subunit ClpA